MAKTHAEHQAAHRARLIARGFAEIHDYVPARHKPMYVALAKALRDPEREAAVAEALAGVVGVQP